MGEFQFQPTTLLAVLNAGFYKVPIYQRSYSWDLNQIHDFWHDITRAISDGGEYFLGTLVFSNSDDDGLTSVIDGQQRLATTTILLAALRDKWSEQGKLKISQTYSDVIAPTDLEDYEDNKPWAFKQPKIALSDLALNKAVASEHDWRVQEIEKRQVVLAQIAALVWRV